MDTQVCVEEEEKKKIQISGSCRCHFLASLCVENVAARWISDGGHFIVCLLHLYLSRASQVLLSKHSSTLLERVKDNEVSKKVVLKLCIGLFLIDIKATRIADSLEPVSVVLMIK